MCGIAGIVGPQTEEDISRLNRCLFHRGPDERDVFREAEVSLGMRRLSIIDRTGGHQPMQNDDGRYVLIYNGEIFNAGPLRRELEAEGAVFRTDHSDTEVLLQLLIRHGEAALPRLNGMFAFALFDRREQTILCARDRFGIKPLFYAAAAGRVAFASEVKALLLLPWVDRSPNLQSLFHYFTLHFVPGPDTAFSGIKQLRPGEALRIDVRAREESTCRWWAPSFGGSITGSRDQIAERLSPILAAAVDRWAISDVPIGCLLSGGLDSSGIVSMLARKGHTLRTFTVGFSGPGEEAWDELRLAKRIAGKWGTTHEEIVLDPESLLDDLADMVSSLDEPYGGGLPSWSVFKAMGGGLKVAMTGTGGDELFGTYDKYRLLEGRYRSRVPGLRRRTADRERFEHEFVDRYYYASDAEKRRHIVTDRFAEAVGTGDLLWSYFSAGPDDRHLRDRVVHTDLSTQLPDEFLMMTDRFSMAHSIEARTPLLDNDLAEAVYNVDASVRLSPHQYKPLLRRMVASLLPPELMAAPKRGFVIPLKLWLKTRLVTLQRRLLAPARLSDQGLIRSDFYERYAAPHIAGAADHTHRLWNMLMFQLWWELYVAARPLDELRAEIRAR
jgi:asparagine synthase (glutamine-hydrolysing)